MKIKKNLEVRCTDFWYDLFDGGYLKPEEICADKKDAEKVLEAIAIIEEFRNSCEEQIDDFIQ